MFERNSVQPRGRRRRGAAALLACIVAVAGLGVVAAAQPAAAAPTPLCDVVPERCHSLPTFSMDPYGALDAASFTATSVRVTGWAGDPNTNAPIDVVVSVDGAVVSRAPASLSRIGHGNLGFDVTVTAPPTSQHVCVTAVNVGAGNDVSLGCPKFPYSTDFAVPDVCGLTKRPLTASLWQLSPPTSQVVQESTLSSGGRIGFVTGPSSTTGSLVGLSLSDPTLPGPLYRSGPMSALPAGSPDNPTGALNVTVPCPQRFTAAEVIGMSGALNTITPPAGMTITGTLAIPGNGTLDLTLTGTFNSGFVSVPFTYTHSFTVTPSMNMNNPAEIVVVGPTGPGTVVFGGWGVALNLGWPQLVEPMLTAVVGPALQSGLNGLIASRVASTFPGGLPAGATTSAPRVIITPSGVSLTLAVGSFG